MREGSTLNSLIPCEPYKEIEHTADLALHVCAPNLELLFVYAAQGMFSLMHCEPAGEPQPISHPISIESFDAETLLVDWLSELLYLRADAQDIHQDFTITLLEPTRLVARVQGLTHHPPRQDIKAVTFHDLAIRQTPVGYETIIVFDV